MSALVHNVGKAEFNIKSHFFSQDSPNRRKSTFKTSVMPILIVFRSSKNSSLGFGPRNKNNDYTGLFIGQSQSLIQNSLSGRFLSPIISGIQSVPMQKTLLYILWKYLVNNLLVKTYYREFLMITSCYDHQLCYQIVTLQSNLNLVNLI